MDAHFPNVYFNQCSTPNTRDIKWTHICLMSTLIYALPPNIRDKMDEQLPDVYLNPLLRKLVILNGRSLT